MPLIIGKVISFFRSLFIIFDSYLLNHKQYFNQNILEDSLSKLPFPIKIKSISPRFFLFLLSFIVSIVFVAKTKLIFSWPSKTTIQDDFTTVSLSKRMMAKNNKQNPVQSKEELVNLSKEKPLSFAFYYLNTGETLSSVAKKFELSMSTLISLNNLENVNMLSPGQKILVSSISGIIYQSSQSETLEDIATRYKISIEDIQEINQIKNIQIVPGTSLFLPKVSLPSSAVSKVLGYTFINPVPGYRRLSSHFGWRRHPKSKRRRIHAGIDLAAPHGSRILAAREGRVIFCGGCGNAGLTTKIKHHNGLTTVYAHQAKSLVRSGDWVKTGQHIGYVGTTGITTGPHLHFEVRKFGQAKNPLYSGLKLR